MLHTEERKKRNNYMPSTKMKAQQTMLLKSTASGTICASAPMLLVLQNMSSW